MMIDANGRPSTWSARDVAAAKATCEQNCARLRADLDNAQAEITRLRAVINQPETNDFLRGVSIEAEHARKRWAKGDIAKTAFEWMGLVLFLAGKCIKAYVDGNKDTARHHAISTAAALLNFHKLVLNG